MSTPLLIPCPECGAELKLKDQSKLGKKARCPKCSHIFLLAVPGEVELSLASSPQVGTSAQWVPDQPTQPAETKPATEQPGNGFALLGDTDPDEQSATSSTPSSRPSRRTVNRRKKSRENNRVLQWAGGAVLAVVLAAGWFVYDRSQTPDVETGTVTETNSDNGETTTTTTLEDGKKIVHIRKGPDLDPKWEATKRQTAVNARRGDLTSPTNGPHIQMKWMPNAHVVLHLRPAELFSDSDQMREFRACLTQDLTDWLAERIKTLTLHEPAQVEEFTLGIILGTPGDPPEYTGLVRLKEPSTQSTLVKAFGGIVNRDHGYPIYVNNETRTTYLIDESERAANEMGQKVLPTTFAFAPTDMRLNMVESAQGSTLVGDDIQKLLDRCDRDRHFTAVFIPQDLLRFEDYLFGENLRPAVNEFLTWFGDETRSVAWSVHLGNPNPAAPQPFFSEVLLRNDLKFRPQILASKIRPRLETVAPRLLDGIRKMKPATPGLRAVIGRFPAMVEAYRLNTHVGKETRIVKLTTVLPERAGPNLAAGLLLTWDESTRTDFSADVPVAVATGPKLPPTLAGRLAMQVDIEFARTPLQEAFDYLTKAVEVTGEIDGDALKFAGMTKNMPQTFTLGTAPVKQGLQQILNGYVAEGMVIVADEQNLRLILTTKTFAEKNNQKIFLEGVAKEE